MHRLSLSAACALWTFVVAQPVAAAEPLFTRYGALPEAIRQHIETEWQECQSTTRLRDVSATRLDVNDDGHADYAFQPNVEMSGSAGYCSANWVPVLLWVYAGSGAYREITLGSSNALLHREGMFVTTNNCSGGLTDGGVSLAVFDRQDAQIVSFGRCYADMIDAVTAARSLGFELVSLDGGK